MRRSTPTNGRALPVVRDDPTNTTSRRAAGACSCARDREARTLSPGQAVMGHVARTPAPGDLFAGLERYNGMTPPFGITMLRSFTLRHHDVAIVSLGLTVHKGRLIGFANVTIGILFDNLRRRLEINEPTPQPSLRAQRSNPGAASRGPWIASSQDLLAMTGEASPSSRFGNYWASPKLPKGGSRLELCPPPPKGSKLLLTGNCCRLRCCVSRAKWSEVHLRAQAVAFGSLARGEDRADSDIDIMAEIAPDPRIPG